jgi:hypothetical protein
MKDYQTTQILTSCGTNAIVFWNENQPICSDLEHLRNLIEQDILFSELETVNKIFIIRKNYETEDFYTNENAAQKAVSYFHTIEGVEYHIRIS